MDQDCLRTKYKDNSYHNVNQQDLIKTFVHVFYYSQEDLRHARYNAVLVNIYMCGSRKFCQRGSKFDYVFFLVYEVIVDPNITINGPSSARQRNAI